MKNYHVTMVNPQQIVLKGLKGCSSTRTVMSFAQKYGVPSVWWSPNRNQKVMLVDWPQFRTIWNQVSHGTWIKPINYTGNMTHTRTNYKGTNNKNTNYKGTASKGTWNYKGTTGYKTNSNYSGITYRGTTPRTRNIKANTRTSHPTTRRISTNYRTGTYTKRTGRAA
jgi:hypothetical protein